MKNTQALLKLTYLIMDCANGPEREELVRQHRELSQALQKHLNTSIKEGTEDYKQVAEQLDSLVATLESAKARVDEIIAISKKVAMVVDLITKAVDKVV